MKLSTVLQVHSDPQIIIDTVHSILEYATDDILLLINGSSWSKLCNIDLNVNKVKGFRHDVPRSPYRNVALGLKMSYESHPDADWHCYSEYDTVFASDRFKKNLEMAEEKGIWMLGNCGHIDECSMPLIESMVGEKFRSIYYMLGCCQFFHRKFMEKLDEIDFFDRFLFLTNSFSEGHFPAYSGYDISEHMYPTLCRHFGGNIGVFASWDEEKREWHGSSEYFPMRWKPDIEEGHENASIIHPLKTFDHPVREFHRKRRKIWKNF